MFLFFWDMTLHYDVVPNILQQHSGLTFRDQNVQYFLELLGRVK